MKSGAASAGLRGQPAGVEHLVFIAERFAASYTSPADGLGYPRFEDVDELLAELRLYEQSLSEAFVVLLDGDRPAGVVGVLGEPGDETGYLAGPLVAAGPAPDVVRFGLCEGVALGRRRGHARLTACIQDENTRLLCHLERSGWTRHATSIEMEVELRPGYDGVMPRAAGASHDGHVVLVEGHRDNAVFRAAARLLAEEERWDGPTEVRLIALLEEGYRCGAAIAAGEVVGTAVWIKLDGTTFGRLDYLVVRAATRRRGVGSSLVGAALRSLREASADTVYLSVDPANVAARGLYEKHGFRPTIQAVSYRRTLT